MRIKYILSRIIPNRVFLLLMELRGVKNSGNIYKGDLAKQKIIKDFQKRFSVKIFIETGTYKGDMIKAQLEDFSRLISIEIDEKLYEYSKKRFRNLDKVELYRGDSGKLLPVILEKIDKPCIFWLDGHYSGGITAKGEFNTPVESELGAISKNRNRNIILIDDANLFTGENDYPELEEIKKFVNENLEGYLIEVKDNIITIYPE